MKITFVLQNADLAGGVRVVATYAQKLHARGHTVTVVSTPNPVLPVHLRLHALLKGHGWPTPQPLGPSHLDTTDVEHHILDRYRPVRDSDVPDADVVVATTWRTGLWVAALSPTKGAKAHLMQHYESWAGHDAKSGVDRAWRLPTHKIVISKWLADLARDRFAITDASHVPNSVDLAQFHAPPRDKQPVPTVGFLYHDLPFKGIDVTLRAIALARQQLPDFRVLSYGREIPSPNLPLPENSTFIRRPAQDTIKDIYAQCDAWLCGSRAEGFHLPPLEAMACRTPVVSTRVGGPVDIIDEGLNGHLVPIEDPESLADRLIKVLTLPNPQWRAMSDAAHHTATRYTWDDATDLFEQALRYAIDKQCSLHRSLQLITNN